MIGRKSMDGRATLAVALLCVAMGAGMRAAQESFPDMPTYNIFTNEELQRDFVNMIYEKPLGRVDLGFQILIPKTWEEVPVKVPKEQADHDDENIIPLALHHAPEKTVTVEVAYCRVPETTELEKWARGYLEQSGLELLRFQIGTFQGRKVFDTLIKADVEGEGEYRVRMTFSLHGDKLFIVSASAPASLYDRYMKALGLAVVAFRKS